MPSGPCSGRASGADGCLKLYVPITPDQIRAARALLRLDQEELARHANVSVETVRRLEGPNGLSRIAPATLDEVRRALESAGAKFIDEGVKRRKRSPDEIEAPVQAALRIAAECAGLLKGRPNSQRMLSTVGTASQRDCRRHICCDGG